MKLKFLLIILPFFFCSCGNSEMKKDQYSNSLKIEEVKVFDDFLYSFDSLLQVITFQNIEYSYRDIIARLYYYGFQNNYQSDEFNDLVCLFNNFLKQESNYLIDSIVWCYQPIPSNYYQDRDTILTAMLKQESCYIDFIRSSITNDSIYYYYNESLIITGSIPANFEFFLVLQNLDYSIKRNRLFVAIHILTYTSNYKCLPPNCRKSVTCGFK